MKKVPTLQIKAHLLMQLFAEAAHHPLIEICGLIGGEWRRNAAYGTSIALIPNIAPHPSTHFLMSGPEQAQAMLHFWQSKIDLIAIFHSHPNGPPHPSAQDIAECNYPEALYLILFPVSKTSDREIAIQGLGYGLTGWQIDPKARQANQIEVIEG